MKVARLKSASKDARGVITDILDGTPVESVTMLTCRRGSIRGNHFHKKTTQYTYVLEGRFRMFSQVPGGKVRTQVVRAGDLVTTPPRERHAFVALTDSLLIACAHGPRSGKSYESDTYRLEVPLTGPKT